MIQATATAVGNFFRLEIVHPAQKQLIFKKVASLSEARRVVYMINRGYMRKKLLAWVKQRKHADARLVIQAAKLQALLLYYEPNIPFARLCAVVHKHRGYFEALAPGPLSGHYKYYLNTIVPILNDAAEIAG